MTIDVWDGLIGAVLPFIVGILSKKSWPGFVKGMFLFLLSLIIAGVKTALSGQADFSGTQLFITLFAIFGSAQLTFMGITKEFAKQLQDIGPIHDAPPPVAEVHQPASTNF